MWKTWEMIFLPSITTDVQFNFSREGGGCSCLHTAGDRWINLQIKVFGLGVGSHILMGK